MMPFEPTFLQTAAQAAGDVCLPWAVAVGIPTALTSALVFQTRRLVLLTERTEARYDALLQARADAENKAVERGRCVIP